MVLFLLSDVIDETSIACFIYLEAVRILIWAYSSTAEHGAYTSAVLGSNPSAPTNPEGEFIRLGRKSFLAHFNEKFQFEIH